MIIATTFSPIIIDRAWVLPLMMLGMIDESITPQAETYRCVTSRISSAVRSGTSSWGQ